MSIDDLVKSVISKKDPQGYYVIVADREARDMALSYGREVLVEEYGDTIVIRTKSRRIAEQLARILAKRNLLRFEL